MGVAVGFSVLGGVEPEITWGKSPRPAGYQRHIMKEAYNSSVNNIIKTC
jgi:hypothetical protein